MFIKQLYTGCISEAAYFIESNGEAAIIDPLRDIDVYLQLASEHKSTIKYIFETHFHADFISGHIDLAKATGAKIVYGPNTVTNFEAYISNDYELFHLGEVTIQALHTPGHTLESTCYLLKDENNKDYCLFTGDTLFVGDVGRPDLAQKTNELTSQDLAGMMYDSVHTKIMPLADDVIIYPAHGPGSACGKNLGSETYSTLGTEKENNYALKATSKSEFIHSVLDGLAEPPQYFPINAKINKEGYESLDKILMYSLKPLSVIEVKKELSGNTLILDTRPASLFTHGFIPGSLFIGLEGRFAEWAGSLLSFEQNVILITEPGKEKEAIVRLARVGFNKVIGYLVGGFEAWKNAKEEIDMIIEVEADELAMDLPFDNNLVVLDVRKITEFAEGHVRDAINIPLEEMKDLLVLSKFEENQNIYIHCQGGYRSTIASSILKQQGLHNIRNVIGGWNNIKEEKKIPTEKDTSVLN